MTKEELIEMARQAGAMFDHITWVERDLLPVFERFAKLVAEKEREQILFAIKEVRGRSQEPVAFASHGVINWIADKQFQHEADLYTTPPHRPWVGLTDEEAIQMHMDCNSVSELFDAIESKLKYKNTRGKE